jgi:MFS transporter, ACS family, D-galactonate transporter
MLKSDLTNTGASEARPTRVRWKILFLLMALAAINYIDRTSISVAMPVISKEFELTPQMQGVLLSAFFWTYALSQIPGGFLADLIKPRVVIAGGTFLWGIVQCIAAAPIGWFGLLAARLGLGAAEGPFYPAANKLTSMWMPPGDRGRGVALFGCGAPLGAAIGAATIAGLIAGTGSWRLAFVATGVGTTLVGLLSWRMIRNRPEEHPEINESELNHIREGMARAVDDGADETVDLATIFRGRSVWLMLLGWVCANSIWHGLLTWMPSYLAATHNLKIAAVGGFSFVVFFAGAVGELVGGGALDYLLHRSAKPATAYRTVFGVSAVLATISMFIVAYATDLTIVVAFLAIGLFFTRWSSLYWVIPPILSGQARCGVLSGVMNFSSTAWGAALPILIGYIVQSTGSYFLVLCYFGASGLVLLTCSLCIDYRAPKRTEPAFVPRPANSVLNSDA